jgi:3-phosphoshikimate 1-carboxyvinyltransferase
MAMAFAPAAALCQAIVIKNAEVVSKSYPNFWDDLRKAGFEVKDVNEFQNNE